MTSHQDKTIFKRYESWSREGYSLVKLMKNKIKDQL